MLWIGARDQQITGATTMKTRRIMATLACLVLGGLGACGQSDDPGDVEAVSSALTARTVKINCAGLTVGAFAADTTTGTVISHPTAKISVAGVDTPAPAQVYTTARGGNPTYTIGGFGKGAFSTVRLHFAETYTAATTGSRLFTVAVNGVTMLTKFDIYVEAGKKVNQAVVREQNFQADANGNYVIKCKADKDQCLISGIEVNVFRCNDLPLRAPHQTITNESYNVGAVVTYSCDAGFPIQGVSTVTCNANGAWSAAAPTCGLKLGAPCTATGSKCATDHCAQGRCSDKTCDSGCGTVGTNGICTLTKGVGQGCEAIIDGNFASVPVDTEVLARCDADGACNGPTFKCGTETTLCSLLSNGGNQRCCNQKGSGTQLDVCVTDSSQCETAFSAVENCKDNRDCPNGFVCCTTSTYSYRVSTCETSCPNLDPTALNACDTSSWRSGSPVCPAGTSCNFVDFSGEGTCI
jgi:hypothetical protein